MISRGAMILILMALTLPAGAQPSQGTGRGGTTAPPATAPRPAPTPAAPPPAVTRPEPAPIAREAAAFLGNWRIGAAIARTRYAIMTPPVQASLAGRDVNLGRDVVVTWVARSTAVEERCDQPGYDVRRNTRARLASDYRMPQEELRAVPESFSELTVTCRGNHLATIRAIDANVGVIDIDGVFFRIERAQQAAAAPPPGAPPRPSFDCAQARRPDERLICGDVALANADRNMAETFARAVATVPEPQREALRREQRDWLARRPAACNLTGDPKIDETTRPGFIRCLTTLYTARQRQLEERLPKAPGR